jgi:hypothetical protein
MFMIGYLEKGVCGVKGTLNQGEQENSFGQFSSLSKQFEIRSPGNKQLFILPQELCKVKQPFTKHVGSNSWRLVALYIVIVIY